MNQGLTKAELSPFIEFRAVQAEGGELLARLSHAMLLWFMAVELHAPRQEHAGLVDATDVDSNNLFEA